MNFGKAYLPLVALGLALFARAAEGDVAYSNLPADPPFNSLASGSNIFGSLQDPMMNGDTSSIAMSFVSSETGTISSIMLGITFIAPGNGNVNVYLAENPVPSGPTAVFASQLLLGQVTTTAPYPTTNNVLTTLTSPTPLQIISGNTYYLVLEPTDPNTSVVWNENVTGANSTYYFSTDMGSTFTLAGIFGSDALEVGVDITPVPEASTWVTGALLAGLLGLAAVRRIRAKAAKS